MHHNNQGDDSYGECRHRDLLKLCKEDRVGWRLSGLCKDIDRLGNVAGRHVQDTKRPGGRGYTPDVHSDA